MKPERTLTPALSLSEKEREKRSRRYYDLAAAMPSAAAIANRKS